MKRIGKFIFMLIVSGLLMAGVNSCEKDKSESKDGVKKFLSVNNAELITKNFPSASSNGPEIDEILGNSSVIEGGSNPVTVYSSDDMDKILVGVEGQSGYYEYEPTNKISTGYCMISIVLSTEIPDSEFVIVIAIIDADGLVSEIYELPVEIVEVGTGKLQVSLSWDQPNDVDLQLVEPDEEVIYFSTDSSSNGGILDLDSNPGCSIDGINNENITYSEDDDIEAGEYVVKVDLYSNCSVVEKTNYIVTARFNGKLISGSGITNPFYGSFDPEVSYDYPVEVMNFTLSSNQLKSTISRKMRTIKFPNERRYVSSRKK